MLRATQTAVGGWAAVPAILLFSPALLRPSRLSWSNFPTALGRLWPNPSRGTLVRSHLGRALSVASEAWLDQRRDLSWNLFLADRARLVLPLDPKVGDLVQPSFVILNCWPN